MLAHLLEPDCGVLLELLSENYRDENVAIHFIYFSFDLRVLRASVVKKLD